MLTRSKRKVKTPSALGVNPAPKDRDYLLGLPVEILQNHLFEILRGKDRMALATTSRYMASMLLPRLYTKDVMKYAEEGMPFALQWAACEGSTATLRHAVAAIDRVPRLRTKDMISRLFKVDAIRMHISRQEGPTYRDTAYNLVLDAGSRTGLVHIASSMGHNHIVRLLCEEFDHAKKKDSHGGTALTHVTTEALARYLVDQGATFAPTGITSPLLRLVERMKFLRGETPTHSNMRNSLLTALQYLVSLIPGTPSGSDVYWSNGLDKHHPFFEAISSKQLDIVRLMLDAGWSTVIRDPATNTAFSLLGTAFRFQASDEMIQMLIDAGADLSMNSEWIACNIVMHSGKRIPFSLDIVRTFFQHNGNFKCVVRGKTPLFWALKNGHWEYAILLVELGATWGGQGAFLPARTITSLLSTFMSGPAAEPPRD